jgi:hypothetical protein
MIIHVECLPDEVLVKSLGKTRKQVIHHNDKGRVCKFLEQSGESQGMIDQDPNSAQPTYLSRMQLASSQYDVQLLTHPAAGNRMIILCPRLEEWVINVCQQASVEMSTFGLSNNPRQLHREITSRLRQFSSLLDHLKEKQAPAVVYLRNMIH